MENPKKNKFKKVLSAVLPIIFAGLFGYGMYSYYYEFKNQSNVANIILNLVLVLVAFSVLNILFLKKKRKPTKKIIARTVIADLLLSGVSAGLPYLVNSAFGNKQWEFSVSVSLEIAVFMGLLVFLSCYLYKKNILIKIFKVVVSGAVTEITFKSAAALVMSIVLALGSLGVKENANLKYTELEQVKKAQRAVAEYAPSENDIYVDARFQGGDGSKDRPFSSLYEAQERIRALRASGVKECVTVWLQDGEYILDKTLAIDSADCSVSFVSYPEARASFTGAKAITGFTEESVNGVKVFAADVPEGMRFDSIVKDGKTLPKTRYPESGYLQIETEDHSKAIWIEDNKKWEYNLGDTEFIGNSQFNPEKIENIENACVRILHYWVTDFVYLTGYDASANKYTLANPTTMTIKSGDRYYFENILEALDKSGEWYLDSAKGKVYYIPFENETPENTVLYACVNDKLVDIKNAENVEFFGIEFKNTNFTYPEELEELSFFYEDNIKAPQAEIDVGGAIEVAKSNGIRFTNCDFRNIGNTALKFNKVVKNCDVVGCIFENIGGTGVFINGHNTGNLPEISENINVVDNKITSYGRNWMSAIGVLQTNARSCTIKNNEISDGYYTAISVGWVWGYDFSVTSGNKIQDNLIYDIGQGWLSDMGGIYTLGEQKGTVISGNVIHDVAADSGQGGYGGWGIYLDEGSSYIEVKNNLVYDCGSDSFHQHYGKDNKVTNNIFALSESGQVRVTRNEDHNEIDLTGNIILTNNSPAYILTEVGKFTDDGNLYWDMSNGGSAYCSKYEHDEIKARVYKSELNKMGYFKNGVFENPQFRDAQNGDFTIADGNTAIGKIGFTPWNYNEAGTLTDFDAR